jgi:hypothetical protein
MKILTFHEWVIKEGGFLRIGRALWSLTEKRVLPRLGTIFPGFEATMYPFFFINDA